MKTAPPRPVHRLAARFVLLLMLPLTGLAGCDAILGTDDDEGIEGTWVLNAQDYTTFLQITSTEVTVYDGSLDDCFYVERYTITEQDGDQYTLTFSGSGISFSMTLTIRRDGDSLVVTFTDGEETDTETFQSSDQDLSQVQVCTDQTGGGGDPAIDCGTLPAVGIGGSINGELTTSDDMYQSRYFDLYGLTVGSQTSVQIDAVSDPVDMYLYLYEADGTLLEENDDAGSSFNSQITRTLAPGCYRVEVTSYDEGATGTYTLSVN